MTETVIECQETTVTVIPEMTVTEIQPNSYELVVTPVGATGPASTVPGPAGPTGPAGPAGGTDTFIQNLPASQWTITHSLAYRPNVSIVDSGGTRIFSELQYVDATTILATFTAPFSGVAYLS